MQQAKETIAVLLQQAIGLDVSSIGEGTLVRAVNNRMKEKGTGEIEAYVDTLRKSTLEMRKLVEEVVVPETWFFRDQEPFNFLSEYIFQSGKDLSSDTFRILSLPCSTGEEPYSVAMTLFQAGLQPTSFYIDAIDVSERVLKIARKGFYRQNSFRTSDLSFRDNYFHPGGHGYTLNGAVRNKVRFLQGNILQPGFMESLGLYDVVFCRNVLIYFNDESRKQAIKALYNLLIPGGLLFTGHSEAGLFLDSSFVAASHSRSFAFYKENKDAAARKMNGTVRGFGRSVPRPKQPVTQYTPKVSAKVPTSSEEQEENKFFQVQQMADRGELQEAASLCEKYLSESGPSAQWYYLLGVIRDSQGESQEAVKLLRKAVYLDPQNIESLVQLSLLAERAGDPGMAANYKRRAKRLQDGG